MIFTLQNACWIFSNLYIPPCVAKILKFMVFKFLENVLNLCIFTQFSFPHSEVQAEFFENLFSASRKGWGRTMICFIKIQSENMKWTLDYLYFPFVIFLNVMALQFWKYLSKCGIKFKYCLSFATMVIWH